MKPHVTGCLLWEIFKWKSHFWLQTKACEKLPFHGTRSDIKHFEYWEKVRWFRQIIHLYNWQTGSEHTKHFWEAVVSLNPTTASCPVNGRVPVSCLRRPMNQRLHRLLNCNTLCTSYWVLQAVVKIGSASDFDAQWGHFGGSVGRRLHSQPDRMGQIQIGDVKSIVLYSVPQARYVMAYNRMYILQYSWCPGFPRPICSRFSDHIYGMKLSEIISFDGSQSY